MTRGISEDDLRELRQTFEQMDDWPGANVCHRLVKKCKELNPWLPIENAPKDKRVSVYVPGIGQLVTKDGLTSYGATHYQELPEDPK